MKYYALSLRTRTRFLIKSINGRRHFGKISEKMNGEVVSRKCKHVFKIGERKGTQCPTKTKNESGLCGKHKPEAVRKRKSYQKSIMKEIRSSPVEYQRYLLKFREYNKSMRERDARKRKLANEKLEEEATKFFDNDLICI